MFPGEITSLMPPENHGRIFLPPLLVPERIDRVEVRCLSCRVDAAEEADHDPETDTFSNRECIGCREQVVIVLFRQFRTG
jgi:hypothetical protein